MKKEVPSTFILNANDVSYFYVEGKNSTVNGPIYCVYYNSKQKPVKYNAKNFIEVHGINEKESILNFTRNNLSELVALSGYDKRANHIYNTFIEVNKIVSNQNVKSPKLGKMKKTFIDAINSYNEIKGLLPKIEIPYEEDYDLLYGEKKELKKVKKIVTVPSDRKEIKDIINAREKENGLQRKLKYD